MPTLQILLDTLEAGLWLQGVRKKEWAHERFRISYLTKGFPQRRHAVVLVHGLGSNNLSWAKVLLPLARRAQVWAPDMPGWGRSAMPGGRDHASLTDLVEGMIGFLEEVPGRPVTLVGQSLGGWVSAKIAATRPDLVEQLVLVNSAGVLYPEVAELRQKLDVRTQKEVEQFWRNLWHRVPWFYRFFTDDYVAKMHEPRVLGFFDSLKDESSFVNEDLAKITMPTTIIWGTSDKFIPRSTVDVLLAGLPNAKAFWVPECGHIPALEKPREFTRILLGLLPRVRPPDAPLVAPPS